MAFSRVLASVGTMLTDIEFFFERGQKLDAMHKSIRELITLMTNKTLEHNHPLSIK